MDNFNFDELTKLSRKISRDHGDAPLSRTAPNKDGNVTFRFSLQTFNELGLELNSLQTFEHKAKKGVFLKVCPGNDGDFMKVRGGKSKGKKFQHNDLSESLTSVAGITGNTFFLERIGETAYYQIVAAPAAEGEAAAPAPKRQKKVKETANV